MKKVVMVLTKILDTSGLVKKKQNITQITDKYNIIKSYPQNIITEIERKMPSIRVENKTPKFRDLVKKADYNAKISLILIFYQI